MVSVAKDESDPVEEVVASVAGAVVSKMTLIVEGEDSAAVGYG